MAQQTPVFKADVKINDNFRGDEHFQDEMGISWRVLLCRGMFVMLTQNLSVSNGLVNGSSGIIIGILQVENSPDCEISNKS